MELSKCLDSEMRKGWDRNGIYCWSLHLFSSLEFVENNTEHILLLTRRFQDGREINQEFRRYLNSDGKMRFLAIMSDDMVIDAVIGAKPIHAYITDPDFFAQFIEGMRKENEISEEDYGILKKALDTKPEI